MRAREAGSNIMVALDKPDADGAERLVKQLAGIPCWFKVGMELFYAAGPDVVRRLKADGHRVFVDLKMHDIPNTVKGGARSLTLLGADMFNVHASGGLAMMRAAADGVAEGLATGSAPFSGESRPMVIAVTQLTSTSRQVMNEQIGIPGELEKTVFRYAELARDAGMSGVVCSPLEAAGIKARIGADFVTVTPGVRPAWADKGDQSRVATPAEAMRQGADYLVIGRPITAAPDPRAALETIVEELSA